ncbi:MAG: PIN domain-containing protein [Baekduia sp.]
MGDPGFGGPVILDNSAWARLLGGRVPTAVAHRWEQALAHDEVLVCDPFRMEALYSARDAKEYMSLSDELDALGQAPCDRVVWQIAQSAQRALASNRRVSHRIKPVDLLLAAAAHHYGVGVLHYDHDFDILATHAGLSFDSRWLAKRGTLS